MAARKFRTPAERLAAAKAEAVKLEQELIAQAIAVHKQAWGWNIRSKELMIKSDDAFTKADSLLDSIGIEPVVFWDELLTAERKAEAEEETVEDETAKYNELLARVKKVDENVRAKKAEES